MKPQPQFLRAIDLTVSGRAKQASDRADRAKLRDKADPAAGKENIKPNNAPAKLGRKRGRDEQGKLKNGLSKRGPYKRTSSEYRTPRNNEMSELEKQTHDVNRQFLINNPLGPEGSARESFHSLPLKFDKDITLTQQEQSLMPGYGEALFNEGLDFGPSGFNV